MKFIHIADVHLGAEPEGLVSGSKQRGQEIWEALERVLEVCERDRIDLLLIAGDLFHRQPLMRELKELNYMFSKLSKTEVVFIAGNHDHVRLDSYYRTFEWSRNVHPLLDCNVGQVVFPKLETAVYGFSYHQRVCTESLYDTLYASRKQRYEILLAHGGDEKHIPVKKDCLEDLGYDYIAMGHIHKPQVLLEQMAIYAGALEPIDKNDVGPHGYVRGEITDAGVKLAFVPCAKREYKHVEVKIDESTTNGALKGHIQSLIQELGSQHMYKFILRGFRDEDIQFSLDSLSSLGNVMEVLDETQPSYDFDALYKAHQGNLLGRYIKSFQESEPGSIEYEALYEGVQALLHTKRG